MADPAPYRADLAQGPDTNAFWLRTSDGVRIRVGHAAGNHLKGTVFILPGRTEYIEKYGYPSQDFVEAGFDTLTIDWRGQGMADRLGANPMVGHVDRFQDFQKDWSAMRSFAAAQNLPKPWFMVAHSMGGCIGLRALMQGADMKAVVFTGPMLGISMGAHMRPLAWAVPRVAELLGMGQRLAPFTSIESYLTAAPFEDNLLSSDPEMFAYMRRHVEAEPQFGLGGPSLTWLKSAMTECKALAAKPSPAIPALCFVGSHERIVDTTAIRHRMTGWPGGKLMIVDGAEHEVLMEGETIRKQITGSAISLFSSLA
ncbi:alpha/beta fold hydrolase [Marivita hallyeonensis]|uniref:Lysophospholipase n=1 Tax=Marivita hallyeonensis TaxID=996342 RepID=A0A1M5VMY4_9RHOB|nr:alpha/beta hydrolase [Marivita hallyeonensis]SHH76611.1 lysophospholipase [Marivita hallyeonensis]